MTEIDGTGVTPASSGNLHEGPRPLMIPLFAALQSTISAHPQNALVLGGLAIGLAFGFAAARTNFCVMGALSDWRASGSLERLGAVALAAAVAIIGAQTLAVLSLADLTRSMYLLPRLNWAGAILGGVLFGAGMVYAGGCASRNLIRAGGGDLRSVVVLVMVAVAAFAAISGVLGPLRDALEQATVIAFDGDGAAVPNALRQGPSLDWVMSRLGATGAASHVLGAALLALPLLAFALLRSNVLSERATLAGGLVIGALVSAGWWLTGAAYDDMALRPLSPASLTFVRP
ncbi:MAG: YeeE/YedE thiosulfate transporter family protein, partial [Hyphomicrobium sp.]